MFTFILEVKTMVFEKQKVSETVILDLWFIEGG